MSKLICNSTMNHRNSRVNIIYRFDKNFSLREKEEGFQRITLLKKYNNIISAISSMFYSIYYIDLKEDSYLELRVLNKKHSFTDKKYHARYAFRNFIKNIVETEYREMMLLFTNEDYLREHLQNDSNIVLEYKSKLNGWCRGIWIPAEYDAEGNLTQLVYVVEHIEQEKEKMSMLSMLPTAIKENQFKVYYQPVYSLKDKTIHSAEALVRWDHPKKGLLYPGTFIPILESSGGISQLDEFVFRRIVSFMTTREESNRKNIPIAINLSRVDLMNHEVMKALVEEVKKMSIAKNYLRIEITESSGAVIDREAMQYLQTLRKMGVEILMDDYGTGYSSLKGIVEELFDVIKVDKSFIWRIGEKRANAVIRQSIQLAHEIGAKVISEGVETEEQYQFLKENHCDYVQGYYFSKPVPEKKFIQLLESN